MKLKKLILSTAPLACALFSGFSNAELIGSDTKIYIGGDLGYNKYSYYNMDPTLPTPPGGRNYRNVNISSSMKNKASSLGLMVGMRYCENFGAELGYSFYNKKTNSWTIKATLPNPPLGDAAVNGTQEVAVKVRNMYLDFLGYMPVDPNIDFIGAIGIGQVRAKAETQRVVHGRPVLNEKVDATSKISKIGLRLGAGVQYNFNEHFSTRAMVHYQRVGKDFIKNITSALLGLIFSI